VSLLFALPGLVFLTLLWRLLFLLVGLVILALHNRWPPARLGSSRGWPELLGVASMEELYIASVVGYVMLESQCGFHCLENKRRSDT
jgi:hypothetical protein